MRSSGTSLRSAIARSASARVEPMRISCSMRRNSSDSGPGTAVRRAVERLLEAEAGLDRDDEQVEDVGQLARDLVLALLDLAVE